MSFEKVVIGDAVLYLGDCNTALETMEENQFDLAIVDPEYGIGASEMKMGKGKDQQWKQGKKWDTAPPEPLYFETLRKVAKESIIWGGNYFKSLPATGGWIFWDKCRNKNISFGDGELAWTSFLNVIKKASIPYDGFIGADKDGRIHPTQKPVALYKWLLNNYGKQVDTIIDTHMGSGSSVVACLELGFKITAYEKDEEYFQAACKRIEEAQRQQRFEF